MTGVNIRPNVIYSDMKEKIQERLYKKRLSIQARIGDPERMTLKRAKKATLKRFFHDPLMHQVFLDRPDMTKAVGVSFCRKVKNPRNWFLLFDHKVLKFSVPEMFYWAILADKKYNSYSQIAKASEGAMTRSLSDFSILTKILVRQDVVDFVKKESIVKLLLLKIKLNNERLARFIGQYRKDIWDDPRKIIPLRFFSLLMTIVAYLPLSILLRLHIDVYIQVILNKKKR